MQQSAQAGIHLFFVLDRDEEDLEVGVGEKGVLGEAGEASPNTLVDHRVLVGVIPSVGNLQRLDGVDTAAVVDLVKGPGLAGVRGAGPVDGAELDGLEGGVLGAVDGGVHFRVFLAGWAVRWCKNAPRGPGSTIPQGSVLCHIARPPRD